MPANRAVVYDRIGAGYRHGRRPDPRIAAVIWAALGDASPVLNVGAGSGSYEPADRPVAAAEPSALMLAQHPPGVVLQAVAEALPFADGSFGAWDRRWGQLRERGELDLGYRVLVAR
jgi:hypothetical protein